MLLVPIQYLPLHPTLLHPFRHAYLPSPLFPGPLRSRNVLSRLKGQLPRAGSDDALGVKENRPSPFQPSVTPSGMPVQYSKDADLTTTLIKRLRDLENQMKLKDAAFDQIRIDKRKLEDK